MRSPATKQSPARKSHPGSREFITVDVQKILADDPQAGVSTFVLSGKPSIVHCDIGIAGGGMGAVAAAIRAAKQGLRVCLTEETNWLGGQMTAQGVAALDENYLVETSGATRLYQALRESIRQHYRQTVVGTLSEDALARLHPGLSWVTRLSFEPQVAIDKLDELLRTEIDEKHAPRILFRHKVVEARLRRGRISSLLAVDLDSGRFVEIRAKVFLDATELGDLLPLAGVPYVSGAESYSQTGEPHAPAQANPENVQDFTYPFVVEFRQGEDHTISKPQDYDEFAGSGKFTFAGYKMFCGAKRPDADGEFLPFWTYRRLIAAELFKSGFPLDISMINWESNDLRGENIIDQTNTLQAERLARGKRLSLGFLYWLQTEAPRDDGGKGYKELRLLPQVLGTQDGLSKYPYIRESRRIKARRIVVEQDIAAALTTGARARLFRDSVGIGLYPIDIHGHQDVPGAGQASRPFQIPLAAMVQNHVRNLIPACKNIGTTHVTNGAYRLHPVEWAIGEAAGELAAECVQHHSTPARVLLNRQRLQAMQKRLAEGGAPLVWFDDVPTDHPNFAAIQFLCATGQLPFNDQDLHFHPDEKATSAPELTRAQAAQSTYDQLRFP